MTSEQPNDKPPTEQVFVPVPEPKPVPPRTTSELVDFYSGGSSPAGTFAEIMQWDDDKWETTHNFIQWLFPSPVPSLASREAPILTVQDTGYFEANGIFRFRMLLAFERFLQFMGLSLEIGDDGTWRIIRSENFQESMWAVFNHNHLRVTRVLISLRRCGHRDLSDLFYNFLLNLNKTIPQDQETLGYWELASQTEDALGLPTLLQCPFCCGCNASVEEIESTRAAQDLVIGYKVCCGGCGSSTGHAMIRVYEREKEKDSKSPDARTAAIRGWNRRSPNFINSPNFLVLGRNRL